MSEGAKPTTKKGGFCAEKKLDEFARELAPLGIRDVEVRERGTENTRRVVVVVRYGENGVATVDATSLGENVLEERVRALKKKRRVD